MAIDDVRLNFNPGNVWLVNLVLAVIMFGVALDLKTEDFKRVLREPKAPLLGLTAQFVLFPAFTYLLTLVLRPAPSVALGMILIAACPGGNMSNFVTYLAGGNTALSISMTAVSSLVAVLMTPLNLTFWGGMNPETADLLNRINLNPLSVFLTVLLILGIPLVCGTTIARSFPAWADRLHRPFKFLSVAFLLGIITVAFAGNYTVFIANAGTVLGAVVPHNAVAFLCGYGIGRLTGLSNRDVRALTIEVGIQNSALGLTLIFAFFPALGGMALVAGGWGLWHIIAGLTLATAWSRISQPAEAKEPA